jgi:hypothetical protein
VVYEGLDDLEGLYLAISGIKIPPGVKVNLHSRNRVVTLYGPYETPYIG